MSDLLTQQLWIDTEVARESSEPYERKNELIMARQLSEYESPKRVRTPSGEVMLATTGDMICYLPGTMVRPTLDDYEHWPITYDSFREIYEPWDETNWTPTPPESDLMALGCRPYYEVSASSVKRAAARVQEHNRSESAPEASRRDVADDETEPTREGMPHFSQYYEQQQSREANGSFWRRFWELFKN